MPARARVTCLVVALLTSGCGTSAQFDGGVYRSDRVAFRVPAVPAEWRRIDVSDATLAFRDDGNDASILVNGRCTHKDEDTPLAALTNHLIIGTTEREVVTQETLPFDGREALHTVLLAKLDGVKMQYDVYVMKKDGCVYDFVFVSAPSRFERGAPAFRKFVTGFQTLPGSGGA